MDILKELDAQCQARQQWVTDAFLFRGRLRPFIKPIQAVLRMVHPAPYLTLWSSSFDIRVNVTDMKSIEPLLESMEEIIGAEFTSTSDETTYGATRTFSMKDFPLKIIADVSDNGETSACRAVKVGEKIVPVYELKCDDDTPV